VTVSQVLPSAQSSVVVHLSPHAPLERQRYGAQVCGAPASAEGIDCVPSAEHVAAALGVHLPDAHAKPEAQSSSTAHVVLHLVPPSQAKLPAHAAGSRQIPVASQTDNLPSAQPLPQLCPALGYPHAARLIPSHWP
jgi:hypothetical protein